MKNKFRSVSGVLFLVGAAIFTACLTYSMVHLIAGLPNYEETAKSSALFCIFHKFTGFYCPGCGGTRAILLLARGRILTSAWYHPVPLYCALIYLNFMVRFIFSTLAKPRKDGRPILKPAKPRLVYAFILVGLFLLSFAIKNILLLCGVTPIA